jgi:hypothetical protein
MRYISLVICLCAVVLSGCTSTFKGYRQTPQTPGAILQGDDPVEDPTLVAPPVPPVQPLSAPMHTAVPFIPTAYRRVWVAPHKNLYGDAVHGHYCEILFRPAAFQAPPIPHLPPSAPVLLKKRAGTAPPSATMPVGLAVPPNPPEHLQDYLRQMGIGNGQ